MLNAGDRGKGVLTCGLKVVGDVPLLIQAENKGVKTSPAFSVPKAAK